jgi:hypothetical protein
MNVNTAQPAHLAQQQHGHGQQPARPASAQPDKQVQHPAQPSASTSDPRSGGAGPAQQQRPARALRTVAGLALLALAAFITITGRVPC